MRGLFSSGVGISRHKGATVSAQTSSNLRDSGMSAVNRFQTYGLCSLAGVAVLATLDSALGLGGGALLADICRTLLEDEPAKRAMDEMQMEVKPVPLIGLSLAATGAAIFALTREHNRTMTGRSAPDDAETAAILSAMLVVAATQGRASREEIRDVFRIVTGHDVGDELMSLACTRLHAMIGGEVRMHRIPPVSSSIGRRRSLAAALMIGCVARSASDEVASIIEDVALDIGATADDISAARQSLELWQEGCVLAAGVSPVTVLRHRVLTLAPA